MQVMAIKLNKNDRELLISLAPDRQVRTESTFGLPPCAQRMLAEGVSDYQRVRCFRLAVQLKKAGLPEGTTIAGLKAWAAKNRPQGEKRVITEDEILAQVTDAYSRDYRSCGCEDPSVVPYCDPACPLLCRNGNSSPEDRQRIA
jgi:hypothetical protein